MSSRQQKIKSTLDNQLKPEWTNARTLDTAEARTYSEWCLLLGDLKYALNRAIIWEDLAGKKSKNNRETEICASLFRDTVISFVSCFDKQLSVRLDASNIYRQVPGGLEYFTWLTDLRNTWVAHRSGPYRQCEAAILVDDKSGEIQGIGHLYHLYYGPKADAGEDLRRMINIALDFAVKQVKDREFAIKAYVEDLKKPDRLKLPIARTTVPASSEAKMGRRKFRNIKRQSR